MSNNIIIGDWLVLPDQNKLSRQGDDCFVEPLIMEVLVYFAQNPNKVISLEELIENVWKGRVVGDHAIYRIINQIRKILGERDGEPYIVTIRKKGYQLKQEVSIANSKHFNEHNQFTQLVESRDRERELAPQPNIKSSKRSAVYKLLAFVGILLMVFLAAPRLMQSISYQTVKPFKTIKPFSVLIGKEGHPAYSRDGKYISFSHQAKRAQYSKLFVQAIEGEAPFQITDGPGNDISPSWSPDNKKIIFIRQLGGKCQIMTVDVKDVQVAPELVLECNDSSLANEVAWGGGDTIFYTDSESMIAPYKIYRYSLMTSKKKQLTNPETGKSKGDIHFALSNNHKFIAFKRDLNWGSTQVMLLDLENDQLSGLFKLGSWRQSLAWSADDEILFYIDEGNTVQAYSLEHRFKKPVFSSDITLHTIASNTINGNLSVVSGETGIDIWQRDITHAGKDATPNTKVDSPYIETSEVDLFPEFARTSNDVAFVSLRSGQPQIWIKPEEGREFQISRFVDERSVQRLRWSPDDKFLLSSTNNELYVLNVEAKETSSVWRAPKGYRIEGANWSYDGRSVYFSADTDGDWQIYKKSLESNSEPIKVTTRGGYSPTLTSDGQMLYYKYHQDGLWKMELGSKGETRLLGDTTVFAYDALYARSSGFYYLSIGEKKNKLRFYDLATDQANTVTIFEERLFDYTLSNDASTILFPKLLSNETEIKILQALDAD